MESISHFTLAVFIYQISNLYAVRAASMRRCSFGEYWNRVLEICRPCSEDLCEPLTRPTCIYICRDYFIKEVLKTTSGIITTTTTEIVPLHVESAQEQDFVKEIESKGPFILLAVIIVSALIIYLIYKQKTASDQERKYADDTTTGKNDTELQPLNEVEAVQEDGVTPEIGQREPKEGEGNRIRDAKGHLEFIEDGGNQKRGENEIVTVQGNSENLQPLKDDHLVDEDKLQEDENGQHNMGDHNLPLFGYALYERENNCLKIKRANGIPGQPKSV